jgi:hypothetical protein
MHTENYSLAASFGSNDNRKQFLRPKNMCTLYSSQDSNVGQERTGTADNAACQDNLLACHWFVNPGLGPSCPLLKNMSREKEKKESGKKRKERMNHPLLPDSL